MKIQLRKATSKLNRKNRATGIRRNILAASVATLAASLLLATSDRGFAASATWNAAPTNGNWVATGAENNWSTGAATFPGSTAVLNSPDVATFSLATGTTAVIINSATLNINSISFSGVASAMTIGTVVGNSLLLSNGGNITSSAANVETVNAPLIIEGAAGTYSIVNNAALAANTLLIGGGITGGAAGATVLTLDGTNTGANAATGVIANGTATTLALTKQGAGNWNLTNTNTYTGATIINGGTLTVNGSIAAGSTVAVNSGATLAGTGTINGLVNVTSGGVGGTINFGAGGNIVGLLSVGLGNWNGLGTASAGVNVGGTGLTIGAVGNMTVAPGFALNVFNAATLTAAAPASTLTGSLNYTSTGNSTFGGVIAGAASTVTVNTGTLTTANFLRLTGNNTYGGLTTVTSGSLDVGNANGLGGIGAGTTVAIGATLGIDGGVNVGAEALSIAGTGVTAGGVGVGALQGGTFGGGVSGYAGAITLTGNATIGTNSIATTFNLTGGINTAGNTLTLGTTVGLAGNIINVSTAAISGAGGIAVDTGIANLNFSNTYTGATAVNNGGTLNANAAGALSAPVADGGTGTVRSAVTLDNAVAASNLNLIGGFNQAVASLTGGGNSLVNLNGNTLTIGNSLGGAATTMSGVIGGAGGGLIKDGTSTQVLAAANTYTGVTTINAGILNIQHATALGTIAAGTTVAGGATLQIQGGITVGNEALTLSGAGAAGQNGALVNLAGTNNYGGLVTLGSSSTISSDAGVLNLTNVGTVVGGGNALTVTGAGNGSIASILGGTVTSLTKNGLGTWTLTGANAHTGTTRVNAGILNIQNATALGATGAGTTVATSATLQIQGGITVGAEALTLNGTGAAGQTGALANTGGTNNYGGQVTLASASTISSDAGVLNLTNAGTIVGGGFALTVTGAGNGSITSIIDPTVLSLIKTGAGTWTLNGVNIYTGATTVNAGTLQAGVATSAFGIGSAVAVNAAGTLDLNGFNNTIGSLTGAGTVDNQAVGPATLTTGSAGSTTFTGLLTDTGPSTLSLIKVGATTFTLTNANAYTGTTALQVGTLIANNNAAFGTGPLTIAGGTTLGTTTGTQPVPVVLANPVTVNGNFTATTTPLAGVVPGDFQLTGPMSLANGIRTITGGTHAGQVHFGGVISSPTASSGGITFTTAGLVPPVGSTPYVAFIMDGAGANTYTGLTTVNANAFLVFQTTASNKIAGNVQIDGNGVVDYLGVSNQIVDTATVTVNSPGSNIGSQFQGLELRGFNETIATLNGSAAGTVGLGSGTLTVSSGTFAGSISDGVVPGAGTGGKIVKNGAGTLTLSGASSYTGATTVNAGTFNLTGSLTGGTPITVNGAGILTESAAGVISGASSLTHSSTATSTLAGANSYTGTTTINAGTVAFGNAKALGNANLTFNGGTLQNSTLGTTNIPINVNIGPGNIKSNGGTFAPIVGGPDGGALLHDQITTTGGITTVFAGTLALNQTNGYLLAAGDKATLVSAAAGVLGGTALGTPVPAANVTGLAAFSNTPLLIPTVNAYLTSVVLEAMQGSFSALTAQLSLTPNQQAVAGALDSVSALNNSHTGVVPALDFINNQSSKLGLGSIASNLDLLAPEELASVFTIGTALSGLQHTNLQRHFEEIRAEAGSAARGTIAGLNSVNVSGMEGPRGRGGKEIRPPRQMAGNERWDTFLIGSGNFTTVGSTSNASGYRLDTGGVTAGIEYKIAENFVVGIDAGYASTEARLVNGGKVDVDGGQFGIFASYFDMGFYVDAAVHGGVAGYKTRRTALGGVETASPGGSSFSALVAAGYDWKVGGLTVGPTLNFQYTNTRLNGFTENGGSLAPLTVQGHNGESTRTAVGARAFYDANVGSVIVRPELRVGWQHEYSDTSHALTSNFATLGGNAFTVSGPQIGRDSLLVGAGVTVVVNSLLSTFVAYDGELARTNYSSHSVSGGVRIKF